MRSKDVNALTDKIISEMKAGKSAHECFQEVISVGCDSASLVRVEACVFAETRAQHIPYSLQESDEIVALLSTMSPAAAKNAQTLEEAGRGLADAFMKWIGKKQ